MKLLHAFLFVFLSLAAFAQRPQVMNLPAFDHRPYHFGFQLGIVQSGFVMEQNNSRVDSLLVLEVQQQSGFSLSGIASLRLSPLWTLRATPGLSFGQRDFQYTFGQSDGTQTTTVKAIESTWLHMPVAVKFRSTRVNNFASYLVAGGRYSFDMVSNKNKSGGNDGEDILKLKPHDFGLEVGFGMDFFMEYFKFSPEIRMVIGTNNMIIKDGTPLSNPIDRLNSKLLVFALNFEG